MSNHKAPKMYTVKITSGFEQNNRFVGCYETIGEAVNASRYLKSKGAGLYCVAVPVPAGVAL